MGEKYALVLAGGGAKGSYQIGVWKAFKEIGVKFDAILGVSVGSLNGVLMAQNLYNEAVELWNNIKLEDIVYIPEKVKNFKLTDVLSFDFVKNIKKLIELIGKQKGFDSSPLYKLITKYTDEKKIRKSKIDFGLITYRISDFTPSILFLEDIPEGKLKDYLLASASLPGFRPTKIGEHEFIDGGVYNNVPYSIMKARGYKKIIVIDISGLGLKGDLNIEGTETIYIKNSIDFGNILDFRPSFIKNFMELGYLDTLKTFEKIDGIYYFYKKDHHFKNLLNDYFLSESNIKKISTIFNTNTLFKETIKNYLPEKIKYNKYISISLTEHTARLLDIPIIKLYTLKELTEEIILKVESKLKENKNFFDYKPRNLIEKIITNKDIANRKIIQATYIFLKNFYQKDFSLFDKWKYKI
ncbi:MAG: patatin-like phospholipase family protein [Brevinematales bacterium]|nr:patatin-like phospholipase family protein [Brevinematales bacterium]